MSEAVEGWVKATQGRVFPCLTLVVIAVSVDKTTAQPYNL